MSLSSSEQRVSFRSLRKKFIAGATASVLALGALVGFAAPAVAAPSTLVAAYVAADGMGDVILTYEPGFLESGEYNLTKFNVTVDGAPRAILDYTVVGANVTLELQEKIIFSDSGIVVNFDNSDGTVFNGFGPVASAVNQPVINNLVNVSGTTATGTTLNFTPDQEGTYFYAVYDAATQTPDVATIKNPDTADAQGTGPATASAMTASIGGLSDSTSYKIYLVVEYSDETTSPVVEIAVTTLADSTPPTVVGLEAVSVESPTTGTTVATYTSEPGVTWGLSGTYAVYFDISTEGVVTFSQAAAVGDYNFTIEAADANENIGYLEVVVSVTDTTPPVVVGPQTIAATAPGTTVGTYESEPDVIWSVSGVDADLFEISFGGVVTFKEPSEVGEYILVVEATDGELNTGELEVSVTVEAEDVIDDTPPIVDGSDAATVTAPATEVGTYTSEDGVTWTLSGDDSALFEISAEGTVTFIDPSEAGEYNFVVNATDASDNTGTFAVSVTVSSSSAPDDTPPVISGEGADVPTTSAATWTAPLATATDNSGEEITVVILGYSTTDGDGTDVADLESARIHLETAGNTVTVTYSAEDSSGNDATATAVFTAVALAPPTNAAPVITSGSSGTGVAGTASTVYEATATDADLDTITFSIDPAVPGFTINGAGEVTMDNTVVTGTYVLDIEATDGTDTDSVTVTITVSSAVAPAIATATITGTPTVGQVLTAGSTGVTGTPAPTLTYQWKAGGVDISGATSSTFTLTSAQFGAVITVVVTATNGTNPAASATSSATAAVADAPVVSSPTPTSGGTIVAPPVQAPAPTPVAAPQITRSEAFAANSAKLTKELRVSIRKALASNPNAKSAVCRGFVASGTATAADRKLARDRSTAVCNLITKLNPDLDVEVKKVVVASSSKQLRKVRMVLR